MNQAVRKNTSSTLSDHIVARLREGGFLLLLTFALMILMALATYDQGDPGWTFTGSNDEIANKGGRVGAWFADVFLTLFGFVAYLFPLMVAYSGWMLFKSTHKTEATDKLWSIGLKSIGGGLLVLSSTALFALHIDASALLPVSAGGVIGELISTQLIAAFNLIGTTVMLAALLLIGITLLTGFSWLRCIDWVGQSTLYLVGQLKIFAGVSTRATKTLYNKYQERPKTPKITSIKKPAKPKKSESGDEPAQLPLKINQLKIREREKEKPYKPKRNKMMGGQLPSMALLDPPNKQKKSGLSKDDLEHLSRQVEIKLADFGVEAQVVEVLPGPVVTRFELQLAPGLKASKVSNLAKDLARSLLVTSVRVVEVIPGKSVIGVELPNPNREVVCLREVLESQAFYESSSLLALALGKDIAGFPSVVNLAKMPHLLVAGTTGSGKSVGLNAMLLSLLYKATPEQVRMILIDPKMLELSIYEGIPHLLTPVVTDMNEAGNALRWSVAEMERRYQLMAALGVRNITGFNKKVTSAIEAGEPINNPLTAKTDGSDDDAEEDTLEPLPYIVVVIDELADMMMVVGKKVEQLIARIAQKARAAGIHLILATQRPSVDVITGLIKANIPTRIAFQVSSRIDSRTILDQQGAEHLLGHGDMLYLAPGTGLPIRVHGAFVDDHEVHKVVDAWKKQGEPDYLEGVLEGHDGGLPAGISAVDVGLESSEESDPLYDEAVYIVTKTRKASISSIQRRLKIGYNRAARMIEDMEKAGIVSEMQTNGQRDVIAPPPPSDD